MEKHSKRKRVSFPVRKPVSTKKVPKMIVKCLREGLGRIVVFVDFITRPYESREIIQFSQQRFM